MVSSPSPVVTAPPSTSHGADEQLEVEICWCVHQLEKNLEATNLTQKQGKIRVIFLI